MRITLNLATRPFTDLGPALKRLRIAMGVLALVSLLLALGLHAVHHKAEAARASDHSLDGALARVALERQGYLAMMRQPDNAKLMTQAEALNQLFDEKAFSWTMAMENLETVLPGGVQVTALEPIRAKDGSITLHLRVVGPRNLGVDLVRNLEHSRRFLEPRIVGENAEASGNGVNQRLEPVSASNRFDFDLLAEYNPPTPEERKAAGTEARKHPAAEAAGSGTPATPPPAGVRRMPAAPQGARPPYVTRPPYTGATTNMSKPNPALPLRPRMGGVR